MQLELLGEDEGEGVGKGGGAFHTADGGQTKMDKEARASRLPKHHMGAPERSTNVSFLGCSVKNKPQKMRGGLKGCLPTMEV